MKNLLKLHFVCLLLYALSGCQDQIDTFVADNYQKANIPLYNVDVNVGGKLRIRFYQMNQPALNGTAKQIQNYIRLTNISNDSITNLRLLLEIYKQDADPVSKNLMVSRCFANTKPIGTGEEDSLFIDAIYDKVLRPENLKLTIIEWNNDHVFSSAVYEGHYAAYKGNSIVDGGPSKGHIDYLGNTHFELMNNNEFAFIKGFLYPDSTFISKSFTTAGNKYSDLASESVMKNDTLTTSMTFLNSDTYDSLVLTFKMQ